MPIVPPITKTTISTVQWGIPVTDEVNRLTTESGATNSLIQSFLNPVWIPLPMAPGWDAYGGGYVQPQYIAIGKWVHLRGLCRNNTGSTVNSATTVATLPAGYRPIYTTGFLGRHGGTPGAHNVIAVNVNTNGTITAYFSATVSTGHLTASLVFDGMVFTAGV